MNINCPRCNFNLSEETISDTKMDICHKCHGIFLEENDVESMLTGLEDYEDWQESSRSKKIFKDILLCPIDGSCLDSYELSLSNKKAYIDLTFPDSKIEIELCNSCGGLWLDSNEFSYFRDFLLAHSQDNSNKDTWTYAIRYIFQAVTSLPKEVWNPTRRKPILTYFLMAILTITYLIQCITEDFLISMALYPDYVRQGEMLSGILTHGFLHADVFHLLGNLYFLYIFGDNLEDFVGKKKFIMIYMISLITGAFGELVLLDNLPILGASGAIAGLMGAYLLLFPKVKLKLVVYFVPLKVYAFMYFAYWIVMQFILALGGGGGIAWAAHLGGFAGGALVAKVLVETTPIQRAHNNFR